MNPLSTATPAPALAAIGANAATTPTTAALFGIAPMLFWTLVLLVGMIVVTAIALAVQDKLTFRMAAKRAIRSFIQAIVTTLVATFGVTAFVDGSGLNDQVLIKLLVSALLSGMYALASLLHNLLEDNVERVGDFQKIPGT